MLEPWIIDEIRRREEERRRGELPRLEIPVPQPSWPLSDEERDHDHDHDHDYDGRDKHGDRSPERGVVIIGM